MKESQFNQIVSQLFKSARADISVFCEQKWFELCRSEIYSNAFVQNHSLFIETLPQIWVGSDWLLAFTFNHPIQTIKLFESGDISRDLERSDYLTRLETSLQPCSNQDELMQILRITRRYEMSRIAWRAIAKLTTVQQTLAETSFFADACIAVTLDKLFSWQIERDGTPCDAAGNAQQLLVIAAGKLGGEELNFSSDIDLIFAFGEHGVTRGGGRSIENQAFFLRLAHNLIKVLDKQTADGRVFRVDMRLRPFGDAGALVMSFAALEAYYQEHGRDWERYAMIKARVINPKPTAQKIFLKKLLRRFSYRRYVDFSVIESLRELKQLIDRQTKRDYLSGDLKRGMGGIRELEFILQALQLIRGGKEPYLQHPNFLIALERISLTKSLDENSLLMIRENYLKLRQLENYVQMFSDQQTHQLPSSQDMQDRFAMIQQFPDWETLEKHINKLCEQNRNMFLATIRPANKSAVVMEKSHTQLETLRNVWSGLIKQQEALSSVAELFPATEAKLILDEILKLQSSRATRDSSRYARERLNVVMPTILVDLIAVENPVTTLSRINVLLDAIIRRSVYLSLLFENPKVRQLVVTILSKSAWISHILTSYPLTLDELITLNTSQIQPELFVQELQQRVLLADETDQEQQQDILRQFHRGTLLKIAVADCLAAMPIKQVQKCLTQLAEIVLKNSYQLAWNALCERYGEPDHFSFAIIAYGKLGSQELTYQSDLDLVFLYDAKTTLTTSKGEVASFEFALRLTQRIIHMLEMNTLSGKLYALDLRLRPSGASGSLVSSISQYQHYQETDAWIWEHQALVRARPVLGNEFICQQFEQIRSSALCQTRDSTELQQSVLEMRNKMRNKLSESSKDEIDLKNSPGALIDIEFMVQYWALKWGETVPQCLQSTHTDQLLMALHRAECISSGDYQTLSEAYWHYCQRINQMLLQYQSTTLTADTDVAISAAVLQIWQREMESI